MHLLFDVFMAAPFNAHRYRLSFLFSSVPLVNSSFSEKMPGSAYFRGKALGPEEVKFNQKNIETIGGVR